MAQTQPHKHSVIPYVAVWVALLVLTVTTYLTGSMHLGKWALPLALAIACTKAALVAVVFMHLSESDGATRLVFVTSIVFAALLLSLVCSDVATRFQLTTPAGAPFGTETSQPRDQLLEHQTPAE